MTIFNKSLLRYWDIEIVEILRHDLLGIIYSLTFPYSHLLQKKFSPFPLSFRKYIVTLPHAGLRHEEQAILMRTILQWQHSLLPHPYRRIKPSRNCKMRLHTAEMRHDDMFLDKKIKNPLPSQILSVYLPANKK